MKPGFKKFITFMAASLLSLALLGTISLLAAYIYITPRLPDIETLKDVKLQVPLRVYSREGDLMAEFGEMKRSPLKYEEFPELLIKAVLAAEDDRFFEHPGVDYQGILRAAYHLIRTGEKGQGGSTITMQVARNFFLSREKTFLRKFNEIFLALKIEEELSKQDILALYLNKIYLGKRAYGFAAAGQVYYGKKLGELTIAEIAMIAGLPKAPSRYNPVVNSERAVIRRNYVLGRMHELSFIDDEIYQLALDTEDEASVHGQDIDIEAPYVAEMVRSAMLEKFGNKAYTEGFKVFTTVESRHQRVANEALRQALLDYDRRHGYRGKLGYVALFEEEQKPLQGEQAEDMQVIENKEQNELEQEPEKDEFAIWREALRKHDKVGNLTPAVVFQVDEQSVYAYSHDDKKVLYIPWEKLNWARRYVDDTHMGPELEKASDILAEGDIIYTTPDWRPGCSWLAQLPTVGGSLVALRPGDGSLQAAVGGFDFYESKFNRVVQAKRQPGSSFKPFIYTAALDKGYTAASVINDAPVVFEAPGLEDTWRPENYSGKFYGPTRLRQALIKSRNLVSIRLMRDIGIGYSVRYVERFGFSRKNLPRDLSLALGSGAVTPLELAQGYAVFANGGYKVTANYIDFVTDADGKLIWMPEKNSVCEECFVIEEQAEENGEQAEQQLAEEAKKKESKSKEKKASLPTQPVFTLDETVDKDERQQIFQGPPVRNIAPQVLKPQTAFLINTMMRDVVNYGTGRRALSIGRKDLAGKTGTTNDQRDAWFSGFNKDVVTIAWVGFDNPRPLGNKETGARAALPMWINYMKSALKGVGEKPLEQPKGIVSVRIDPLTGKLATAGTTDAIFEYFLEDQVPTETHEALPGQTLGQDGEPSEGSGSGASDITEQLF